MPEFYTRTGTEIATDVRAKFGDEGDVQIDNDLLISWINNGAYRIAAVTPWLKETVILPLLAGTAAYDLTQLSINPPIHTIDSVFAYGRPVRITPWPTFQSAIAGQDLSATTTDGEVQMASLYGDTMNLWPTPNATVAGALTIYYTALPSRYSNLGDPLPVPDRFYGALNDYVFQQALELDENFEMSEIKRQHSEAQIREQMNQQEQSPTQLYPSVVHDPEDYL
jgi:hypothetical protein